MSSLLAAGLAGDRLVARAAPEGAAYARFRSEDLIATEARAVDQMATTMLLVTAPAAAKPLLEPAPEAATLPFAQALAVAARPRGAVRQMQPPRAQPRPAALTALALRDPLIPVAHRRLEREDRVAVNGGSLARPRRRRQRQFVGRELEQSVHLHQPGLHLQKGVVALDEEGEHEPVETLFVEDRVQHDHQQARRPVLAFDRHLHMQLHGQLDRLAHLGQRGRLCLVARKHRALAFDHLGWSVPRDPLEAVVGVDDGRAGEGHVVGDDADGQLLGGRDEETHPLLSAPSNDRPRATASAPPGTRATPARAETRATRRAGRAAAASPCASQTPPCSPSHVPDPPAPAPWGRSWPPPPPQLPPSAWP
eukprot:3723392-Pleurochrysis_carterae.AAC.8